ncbi:MAG TPA: C39 family peptidase, partial [Bacteroidales bacterium]|nr:C39 family peptidase [Bacteroidales bacterium]
TTDYSCGPSSVVTLLGYYGRTADEMQIASEMGTSTSCGTNPQQMADWLSVNGFDASWHENGTLEMLRASLEDKAPVLVEWSDWGGHWVLVVGYDTRNTETMADDVIIFADPYDRHDDNMDGLTWFNAERFFYMWYDALLFDRVMRRVYVRARPV